MSVVEIRVDDRYKVPAGVYCWKGFQNSERDSVIARVQHANRGIVMSYDNLSKGLGLPLGHEDLNWVFKSAVESLEGSERVVILNDTPMTARQAWDALGYTPPDIRSELNGRS